MIALILSFSNLVSETIGTEVLTGGPLLPGFPGLPGGPTPPCDKREKLITNLCTYKLELICIL